MVTHLVHALANDPRLLSAAVEALDSLRMPDTDRQPEQRENAELRGEVLHEIRQLRYEITRPLPDVEGDGLRAGPPADPCPYPGLAPFRKRDAPGSSAVAHWSSTWSRLSMSGSAEACR